MDGVMGVCEVLFFVPDIQKAKAWYMKVLSTEPYFDDENYCAFNLAGTTVGVHPMDDKTKSGVAGQVTAHGVQVGGRAVDNLHPSYLAYVPKEHVGYPVALNAAARWLLLRKDLINE